MEDIRLAASFQNGARAYQESLAVSRYMSLSMKPEVLQSSFRHAEVYGKCHLFLTVTGNPEWPEISGDCRGGERWTDRATLCAKAFKGRIVSS